MGETTISPKLLEDAMLKALPTLFPNLLGTTSNPAVEFYNKFQRTADDYDRDFIKKYDEDLNSTLIFAGLFSAVTSAFIIDVQSKLEPDFEETNHTLLKIVASAALGNIPTGHDAALPEWKGPDSTIIHVQSILYSSLSASLLSAFIAMLGKQWLNRYASVEHGSVVDRGRQRKRKMDGMVTWRFSLVMECLPLMLQAALLLLGYALSNYLFFVNKTVASVIIGFTTFGLLFYLLIVSAATLSYNCPFQTPLSLLLRYLIRFDNKHKRYLKRSKQWTRHVFSKVKKRWRRPRSSGLRGLGSFGTSTLSSSGDYIELDVTSLSNQLPPIFNKKTNWDDHVLDLSSITWMFEMSTDMDVATAIAGFIPEIAWHTDTQAIPLERLYNTVLKCFDHSSGHPTLKPAFRDKAYLCSKALLHMGVQCKCISDKSENPVFKSISSRHQTLGSKSYKGDLDLESTLSMIDCVFGDSKPKYWQNRKKLSFTIPHHTWMAHILLYRTWDILGKGKPLPDDIRGFLLHSLQLKPLLPAPILADCLFIAGLTLGTELHFNDLLVVDKSHGVGPLSNRIYEKLAQIFRNHIPTVEEIDHALLTLRVIACLSENDIALLSGNDVAQDSCNLFHLVMQTPISFTYPQDKKWEAARLTMQTAYKWDKPLPWVKDPQDILVFLDHHFDSDTFHLAIIGDQDLNEPIQNALRALAYASGPTAIKVLEHFDPTEPSFVRGICHVFQDDHPLQLRKAALFFLALISDKWFNTPHQIMGPDQMKAFCVDWASVVDSIEHTHDAQKAIIVILFGMINSNHWRPHIVIEKWKLLEYFTSVPDDSLPLRRSIDNPELMDVIRNMGNPATVILWLAILWLKYKELVPQVQEQLEMVTKEVAQGRSRKDLDMCLLTMDSELEKAKDTLTWYDMQPTDLGATTLWTKIKNLQEAKTSFIALSRG